MDSNPINTYYIVYAYKQAKDGTMLGWHYDTRSNQVIPVDINHHQNLISIDIINKINKQQSYDDGIASPTELIETNNNKKINDNFIKSKDIQMGSKDIQMGNDQQQQDVHVEQQNHEQLDDDVDVQQIELIEQQHNQLDIDRSQQQQQNQIDNYIDLQPKQVDPQYQSIQHQQDRINRQMKTIYLLIFFLILVLVVLTYIGKLCLDKQFDSIQRTQFQQTNMNQQMDQKMKESTNQIYQKINDTDIKINKEVSQASNQIYQKINDNDIQITKQVNDTNSQIYQQIKHIYNKLQCSQMSSYCIQELRKHNISIQIWQYSYLAEFKKRIEECEKENRSYRILVNFRDSSSFNSLESKMEVINSINSLNGNSKVGTICIGVDGIDKWNDELRNKIINNYHNVYDVRVADRNGIVDAKMHVFIKELIKQSTIIRFRVGFHGGLYNSTSDGLSLMKEYNYLMKQKQYLEYLVYHHSKFGGYTYADTNTTIQQLIQQVNNL